MITGSMENGTNILMYVVREKISRERLRRKRIERKKFATMAARVYAEARPKNRELMIPC
jgi:hypothetical protein